MKIATLVAVVAAASAAFGELMVKDGDTLAFLGDSITAGGQSKPDGYVNLVLRSLALEGVSVEGVDGPGVRSWGNVSKPFANDLKGVVPDVVPATEPFNVRPI